MGDNESLNDALIECVKACGGSKQVGHRLWPEKTVDAAQRHLLACLNEDKQERLSPEHLMMLLRLTRAAGHHGGFGYMAADLGYTQPVPMEPRDEVADLMRSFNDSVAQQAQLVARIEKAAGRVNLRAAA